MIRKLVYNFSKRTARNTVPRILKDPKFTREGISKKKARTYEYDLTQEHIKNPHLYYNAQESKKLKRQRYKENKALQSPYEQFSGLQTERDPNLQLQELFDQDLLRKPSRRIINNIVDLEKQKLDGSIDKLAIFGKALEDVQFDRYKLRDFGIYVQLSEKYLRNSKEQWQKITLNFIRQIEKKEYDESTSIFKAQDKKILSNFVHIFNSCYKHCEKFELDQELQYLQRVTIDYFTENFQELQDMNERALFLATLGKVLPKRGDDASFYQDFIQVSTFNHIQVEKLNIYSVLALTHMFARRKIQITAELYKSIEQQIVKAHKSQPLQPGVFSIFVLSISTILRGQKSYSPEFSKLVTEYISSQEFSKIEDISFSLEGGVRLGLVDKNAFNKFEPIVSQILQQQQVNYRVSLQFLRACDKNLGFSEQVLKQLVENVNQQRHLLKDFEKKGAARTLKKFSTVLDLESYEISSIIY